MLSVSSCTKIFTEGALQGTGSVDPDCPLSMTIPKKMETKYNLRNRTVSHPEINSDRLKNVFVKWLVFKYSI